MDQIIDHQQNVKFYWDQIADKLRNYTCADESLSTSTPKSSVVEFIYDKDCIVDTYLQLEHAKIWAVQEFMSDEECDVLTKYGRPRLEGAAVVDEGAFKSYSNTRSNMIFARRIGRDIWE